MKSASANLDTHIGLEVTTLARCWRMTSVVVSDLVVNLTSYDRRMTIDLMDGTGDQVYVPTSSFNTTAISNDISLSVDNLDIKGILNADEVDKNDLRRGLYDHATIEIFVLDYTTIGDGIIKLRKGTIGEVKYNRSGYFEAELRGLTQLYTRNIVRTYVAECDADLGDVRCKIPIAPPKVLRSTSYLLNDFVKANNSEFISLTVLNPDAETGDTTNWTDDTGTLAVKSTSPDPFEGSFYFRGGLSEALTVAHQDIAIPAPQETPIDAGNRDVILSWVQNAFATNNDNGEMQIEFFDGSPGSSLGPVVGAGLTVPIVWTRRTLELTVPALCRTIRIFIRSVRQMGSDNDAYFEDIALNLVDTTIALATDFDDRIYKVTTAGTTAAVQPTFDTGVGNTTADGTVVFTTEEAWSRAIEVIAVDGTELRKIFTVTELTPNSSGVTAGRDFFDDDSMNGGVVIWETGDNAEVAMEIRDFTADDGATIEQILETFIDLPFNVVIGDKARVYRGCFKRWELDCIAIFANGKNHRGWPLIPGEDQVFQSPDPKASSTVVS